MSATLPKILVKQPLKISDHFQSHGGFLLLILFVRIVLNARFLVVNKVATMESYAAFWDIPIPGCVPMVLGKLLSVGCWFCLSICQEILELIPVLCLPIK